MKKTSLYLEPHIDEALARRAAEEGITKAELIRRTLAASVHRPQRPKPRLGAFRTTDGGVAGRDEEHLPNP